MNGSSLNNHHIEYKQRKTKLISLMAAFRFFIFCYLFNSIFYSAVGHYHNTWLKEMHKGFKTFLFNNT